MQVWADMRCQGKPSTFFIQDMGAGLAVVPLMGLLESIAVAKSFGRMASQPHARPTRCPPPCSPYCLPTAHPLPIPLGPPGCISHDVLYLATVGTGLWAKMCHLRVLSFKAHAQHFYLQHRRTTTTLMPTRSCWPSVRLAWPRHHQRRGLSTWLNRASEQVSVSLSQWWRAGVPADWY